MIDVTELQAEIRERPAAVPVMATAPSPLTERERQVLLAMSRGLGRKQIARFLSVSPHTVKEHADRVFSKLHVHTSAAAVALALREGWIR
jgi:DNA-binding NarL/FixJ family response regulator